MNRGLSLSAAALIGVLSIVAAGCKPQPVAGAKITPGRSTPAPVGPTTAPTTVTPEVDAALKNDAYAYYGLGRTKPITMDVTSQGSTSQGSQDVRLLKASPDEAQFEIISTDALAIMGRNVLSLKSDGLRVVESDMTTVNPTEFELPADLKPGSSWTVHQSTDRGAQSMKLTLTQTVVGTEKLKTKFAEYPDALRIDGDGTGTLAGKPVTIKTQSWFVKDRGNVKYSISQTVGGTTQQTIVEEVS